MSSDTGESPQPLGWWTISGEEQVGVCTVVGLMEKIEQRLILMLPSASCRRAPRRQRHGSRSKRFQQIGNAVPPRLAAHVLAMLL